MFSLYPHACFFIIFLNTEENKQNKQVSFSKKKKMKDWYFALRDKSGIFFIFLVVNRGQKKKHASLSFSNFLFSYVVFGTQPPPSVSTVNVNLWTHKYIIFFIYIYIFKSLHNCLLFVCTFMYLFPLLSSLSLLILYLCDPRWGGVRVLGKCCYVYVFCILENPNKNKLKKEILRNLLKQHGTIFCSKCYSSR